MATAPDHKTKFREEADVGQALLDTADAIADRARRVRLNGPEPVYASEKLGHALYKAAEGLALCDAAVPTCPTMQDLVARPSWIEKRRRVRVRLLHQPDR